MPDPLIYGRARRMALTTLIPMYLTVSEAKVCFKGQVFNQSEVQFYITRNCGDVFG